MAKKLIWNIVKWRPWATVPGSVPRVDPELLRGLTDENGLLLVDGQQRILIGAF